MIVTYQKKNCMGIFSRASAFRASKFYPFEMAANTILTVLRYLVSLFWLLL